MGLLRQLQDDAVNAAVPVTSLLRRAKILAARLDHEPLHTWVDNELNGYPADAAVPPYRSPVPFSLKGSFINAAWQATNVAVPIEALPELVRAQPLEKTMLDPIGDIEVLASRDDPVVAFSMPPGLRPYVEVFQRMQCYALWGEVPTMVFKSVVEQVRNRMLEFALEIEKQNPEAGEEDAAEPGISPEVVSAMTANIFYGGTNTLAVGSPGALQTVSFGLQPGDLHGLLDHLRGLGVEEQDLTSLEEAIRADPEHPTPELGGRVKAWLGQMAIKTATGAWQVGAMTGANVLGLAIAKYYGLI